MLFLKIPQQQSTHIVVGGFLEALYCSKWIFIGTGRNMQHESWFE